ncbi:YcgL domain-containing protein [uncultured Halopseudomonas sp.]|uniref:YcgL domain-containing protein n=1 Tax=uncultured Halopseudomonas sp. TaxID=2901193 RepID=UPI0030ED8C1F|tara:strand:+ start:20606 stop:20899 length:294 start_codon:yes stop_codon:yes gene_type:complete
MKVMCSIYRSKRKQGMYLYVPRKTDLTKLPESLMQLFGKAELAMDLVLTEQRTLAREDIHKVLANLESQGYHLQMPPREDEYLIHLPDELMYRNDPI